MKSRATALFEVVWFVLGGLMLFIAVDVSMDSGIKESWYYFIFAVLAFGMYFMRRNTRIKRP
ncbi:MAG: hypothetical protein GY790_22755 [Bacteroidetes bacterium]|nr:hypothetical protein [Bacteroidota bacterium]